MCFNIRGPFSSGASGETREEVAKCEAPDPNLSTFGRQSVAVRPERSAVCSPPPTPKKTKNLKQEADRLQVTFSAFQRTLNFW